MNKYQEALDDLSYPDSSSPCYGCKCGESDCGDWNIKKDILTLKELVDRATPKKPNKETVLFMEQVITVQIVEVLLLESLTNKEKKKFLIKTKDVNIACMK